MKITASLFILIHFSLFAQNYPVTKKTPEKITFQDTTFTDDYTWLEDMRSPEVLEWVKEQNKITDAYMGRVQNSYYPLPTLKNYDVQTQFKIPHKKRAYYYSMFLYSDSQLQTASLGYKKNLDGALTELVNPNFFYKGQTVNIINYEPSVNSKYIAYKLMINGSDRHEIRFISIKGRKSNEVIENTKFGGIAWKGDEGIFYNKNNNLQQFALDSTYQVYYHKIGTDVTEDKKVFDASGQEGQTYYFTSDDGTRLFLEVAAKDESTVDLYYADLTKDTIKLKKFLEDVPPDFSVAGYREGRIYYSSKESDWGDLRSFDPENPAVKKIVVPQYYGQLLAAIYFFENRILCKYSNTNGSYFMLFDYSGKFIKKIEVQKGLEVNVATGDYYDTDIFFYVTSYTVPPILFTLNVETGNYDRYVSKSFQKTTAPFPIDYFEVKTGTYTSRDGEKVPITIAYKKGLKLNGNNPTLLEAYGGFGVVSGAAYDTGILYFMNNGGVYAYAGVRGGGEKGVKWHHDGAGQNKINTLNDFIDAARFLISEGYTSPERLGITGASQGGLLIGSALVQHPELFKVAIPKVGVYDMAKFHQYTIGRFHYDEYGNPDNKEDFCAMMSYSPYHNIKDDVNYPTTLIITSDNDDRVPPVHSYKFAARLQNRAAQINPVYLKTRLDSGHYGITTNQEEKLEEEAEFYSFLLYHLMK